MGLTLASLLCGAQVNLPILEFPTNSPALIENEYSSIKIPFSILLPGTHLLTVNPKPDPGPKLQSNW